MAKSFQVDVVTPEAIVWTGEAEFVLARTTEGELGIMATGVVVIQQGNNETTVGTHGGFLQIYQNQVTLLTDRAEISEGGREEAMALAADLAASPLE